MAQDNIKNTRVLAKIENDTEILTSAEIIDKLKMSDFSLRKMLRDPKFPRMRIGIDYRFIFADVVDYIRMKAEPENPDDKKDE